MSTSGVVGGSPLDIISDIEHATRRCGVLATVLTGEMIQSARENYGLILSNLAVKGLQLWTLKRTLYPVDAGAKRLTLNVGTEDLQNVLLRYGTAQPYTTLATGVATYAAGTPVLVGSVTVGLPVGTTSLVLEASADNVIWTTQGSASFAQAAVGRVAFYAASITTQPYWRVRDLAGVAVLNSVTFLTGATEINMSQLNKDDYDLMPNREFQSTNPLQYYHERSMPQSRLAFWPLTLTNDRLVVVHAASQVQDVGDLTNQIQVPQRWKDAIIFELSTRICLELPAALVPQGRYDQLTARAEAALSDAMDAEVDGSPLRLIPRIGGYTA